MDAKRQGEIAILVVKHLIDIEGVHLSRDNRKQLNDLAKAINIKPKEMREFASIFVRDILKECFPD